MNEMNEMSDNAFWAIVVSVITGGITVLVLGLAVADVFITTRYIGAGYTKTMLPGCCRAVWVKEAK